MILYGDQINQGDLLDSYDVCIVGAGAVGFMMAHCLKASGLNVVVLESGIKNELAHPNEGLAWSQRRFTDPAVAPLADGTNCKFLDQTRPRFFHEARTRCLGGSTNCWGGFIRPLDAYDFDEWPISRSDLDSYYEKVLPLLGLEHFDDFDRPNAWKGRTSEPIDPDLTKTSDYLKTVIIQQQQDTNVLDFQKLFSGLFDADNLTLIRNANATRIDYNDSETSEIGCIYFQPLPKGSPEVSSELIVKAQHYVLAMGGIEIPRFLMLNEVKRRLKDIGCFYMNHPKYECCAIGRIPSGDKIPKVYSDLISIKSSPMAHLQAFVVPKEGVMGAFHTRNFRVALEQLKDSSNYRVELNFEQTPNRDSQVCLDPSRVDKLNRSLPKLDWRFLSEDADTVNGASRMVRSLLPNEEFVALDWKFDQESTPPIYDLGNRVIYTGDHHLGTCRMNSNDHKKDGVVDSNCKVIGFENLWISSTAVFRTGGWANSTFTLLALAARLADRLTESCHEANLWPLTR